MKKSEVILKYRKEIETEMIKKYRYVLESYGRIQYGIYVWDDGNIECLEDVQGSNAYLKEKDNETRTLYYICTVSVSYFDPWDYTDHSAPENETEREKECSEIIDYLVDEYKQDVSDIIDGVIYECEFNECYFN